MTKILLTYNLVIAQDTLYLSDYLERYEDFSLSTYQALQDCQSIKDRQKVLVIPPGVHDFYPNSSRQKYVRMSNNINGMKRIAFPIEGIQNLKIVGNGAEILLHGVMMGMIVHQSFNIEVEDLYFDWQTPFYLQGEVVEVDPAAKTYTLAFLEKEQIEVANNDLLVRRPEATYYIGRSFWFDPETRAPIYNLERRMGRHWNPYRARHYELEDLGGNRIKVMNRIDSLPSISMHFIAKWRNQPNVNRVAPAIHIQDSEKVALNGVKIFSGAGMGIIGEKSTDISLENVQVLPNQQKGRIISTTADATHFVNCKGMVRVENCLFEASLDDGLNIHGNYATLRKRLDDFTLLAEIVHIQQKGFVFATAGDEVAIIDPSTLLPIDDALQVESVKLINDSYFKIRFSEKISNVQEGFGLENLTWNADLIFKNNVVQRNWARGVLFKTGGKILIENNVFSTSMSGVRNWGEMNFFNESGRVYDVTIRRNTFNNVCRVANGKAAVVIFPQVDLEKTVAANAYYNQNIRITDNVFNVFNRAILDAKSVKGLIFSNN
ncbi:MAG: right-handed parallel beta-helix repeat-containing protein, partial [Bacteroidota bacterium]